MTSQARRGQQLEGTMAGEHMITRADKLPVHHEHRWRLFLHKTMHQFLYYQTRFIGRNSDGSSP